MLTKNREPSATSFTSKILGEMMPFILFKVSFCGASPSLTGMSRFSASIMAVTNSSLPSVHKFVVSFLTVSQNNAVQSSSRKCF